MTEQQKRAALASIALRAQIAEESELPYTARSWRDLHFNVAGREAGEIVMAKCVEEKPEE